VIAISAHSSELAIRFGADPARVVTVLPGVDQPGDVARAASAGLSVLVVSRMDETYKGHDVLIRALPLVRSRVPGVRLRLAGDGRLRAYYEHLAASVGTADAIDFLGRISEGERDAELSAAAVFCLPSRLAADGSGEGFGIALLEAGAFGVPVVAGACGGAIDAVVDGETGMLLRDPRDHVELASSLIRLLEDEDRRRQLGEAGRRRSATFTWGRMADEVAAVCTAVIGERR
jgi:phosphatidyl-myo-inositol dimannoside synthase